MASSEGTRASDTPSSTSSATSPESAGPDTGLSGGNTSGSSPASLTEGARVNCLMNARYHAAREAFLDTVHRWFMFAIVILGAAAIVDALPLSWHRYKDFFAASAAILAALDLTFDLSNRARTHALMKRRYFELLADVEEKKKNVGEVNACLNRYSADEEPVFHTLLKGSWNAAQEMIYGNDAYRYEIPRIHRWLQNVRRYEGAEYPVKKSSIGSTGETLESSWRIVIDLRTFKFWVGIILLGLAIVFFVYF